VKGTDLLPVTTPMLVRKPSSTRTPGNTVSPDDSATDGTVRTP
jgi:hypothetical protein